MRIQRLNTRLVFSYFIFLTLNIFYFFTFTLSHQFFLDTDGPGLFTFVLNGDSSKLYFPLFDTLISEGWSLVPPGGFISYIFFFLWNLFYFNPQDLIYVAFVVNNICIILSYVFFVKIGFEILGLPLKYRYLYFFNPLLIYSSQLISKEAFLFFLIPLLFYSLYNKKYCWIFLSLVLLLLVRFQFTFLAFFGIVNLQIVRNSRHILLIFLLILFCLLSWLLSESVDIESSSLSSAGFSRFATQNQFYGIGSLLLVFPKIFVFFYDLISTSFFPFRGDSLSIYHSSALPIVIVLFSKYKQIFFIFMHPISIFISTRSSLLIYILFYLFILSASPLIHGRYLWPILPLLLLLLLSVTALIRSNYVTKYSSHLTSLL